MCSLLLLYSRINLISCSKRILKAVYVQHLQFQSPPNRLCNNGGFSVINIEIVKRRTYCLIKFSFYLMLYIITVLLSIYTANSIITGMYTFQYAWTVAFAFLSGKISFGLSFVVLFALICLLLFLFNQLIDIDGINKNGSILEVRSNFFSFIFQRKIEFKIC